MTEQGEEVPEDLLGDAEDGFVQVATNAFNYEIHGAAGFETVRDLVGACRGFRLTYSNLEEAVEALTAMADEDCSRAD